MLLQTLMFANYHFGKFYIYIISSLRPFYLIFIPLIMVIGSIISLFAPNIGSKVYVAMIIATFVAFSVISISSIFFYFRIEKYKMSSSADKLNKQVLKFRKAWVLLAFIWVLILISYFIIALNFDSYSLFFLDYVIQNFIWVAVPLLLVFLSIILFLLAGLMSRDLIWELINKQLAEKSLLPEIDAYVGGLDGKLDIINGFIINLGKYVQLETKKTFEILKYADIQRISSPKDNK